MRKEHYFMSADRYIFDFNKCTPTKGWAQIDTSQDAWYFGGWANPESFTICDYCEGDVYITQCDNADEFRVEVQRKKDWNNDNGFKFGIDCMCNPDIESQFSLLGLGHLLH